MTQTQIAKAIPFQTQTINEGSGFFKIYHDACSVREYNAQAKTMKVLGVAKCQSEEGKDGNGNWFRVRIY